MKFNQIMGIIYLLIFVGIIVYNFNYFLADQEEPLLIGLLFLVVVLIIIVLVRKVTFH